MTEIISVKQPVRRFDLPRVFATLFRPRQTFSEATTEARSTWLTPMLILSLTALFENSSRADGRSRFAAQLAIYDARYAK